MSRMIVQSPVSTRGMVDSSQSRVWGEGLEDLEPAINISPVVKSAFACLPERVLFKGVEYTGEFVRANDWVELENQGQRLNASRFTTYDFSGWRPK